MQFNFRLLSVITLAAFTTFTACKKESSSTSDNTEEMTMHSDDQSNISNNMDAVTNEVNLAMESNTSFSGGRLTDVNSICGATAEYDIQSDPRKITINYDGADCSGAYTRKGTVVVSMPANIKWKDAGATITVNYQNLKITRVSDKKSITINGSHSITNVSGGLLLTLPTLPSITHTIAGNMTITFDDGSQRTWNVARKRVFTLTSNNQLVITITGNHTDGSNTRIAEWGTNRFGHSFTSSITEPMVIKQDCNFRLTGGQVTHEGFGTSVATFGLDASGNTTSCPGTGHYYFKLTWTGPTGATRTVILPY